jgi:7-carboxy-7-deazaguanine synthase
MKVNEIFRSLQGEGPSIGMPAVFLRLTGCNLRCVYCDTAYAQAQGEEGTPQQIADKVKEAAWGNCRRLVITGGEPLLQEKELGKMLREYFDATWTVELETNGTIPAPGWKHRLQFINCSPKLANSGVKLLRRFNQDALVSYGELPHCYFKFVVQDVDNIIEARALADLVGVHPYRVILMPEGTTVAKTIRVLHAIARSGVAQEWGVRILPRLHILMGVK